MEHTIGIPEIKMTARYEDTDGYSTCYEVEAKTQPSRCMNPECHSPKRPHVHDTQEYLLQDVKAEGKLVFLNLHIRRYQCRDCGMVFPTFSFYQSPSHLTDRLKNEFIQRCIHGETYRYIARDYGVDEKTVSAVFKAYSQPMEESLALTYTPVILGTSMSLRQTKFLESLKSREPSDKNTQKRLS